MGGNRHTRSAGRLAGGIYGLEGNWRERVRERWMEGDGKIGVRCWLKRDMQRQFKPSRRGRREERVYGNR